MALESEKPSPSIKGYLFENQDIAVDEAQAAGRLERVQFTFANFKSYDYMGLKFYIFNDGGRIFSEDCKPDIMDQLQPGETIITQIKGIDIRQDLFEGEARAPIAALLVEEQILFCSKGFDLKAYLASIEQNSSTPKLPKRAKISRSPSSYSNTENGYRKPSKGELRRIYREAIQAHRISKVNL